MGFYEFATKSPWLTFFMFIVICTSVVEIIRAVFNYHPKEEKE